MTQEDLRTSRYIGDFNEGDVYHHGAFQITPIRNRQYIKKYRDGFLLGGNPQLALQLGYSDPGFEDKKGKFGITQTALTSQGFIFNAGFGLSVHDISFNAIANLSYGNLVYGTPVFEGDIIFGKSEVLGKEIRKDGATNGSVQVKTTVYNQHGEDVLEYVRQVLIRARKGETYNRRSSIVEHPKRVDLKNLKLPKFFEGFSLEILEKKGKKFEEISVGDILEGEFEEDINFVDFSWLQISTMNDASIHHDYKSNFIGYGGAVKARVEGQLSTHFPLAYQLAMNNGFHNAPTYPGDVVKVMYADNQDGNHEKIRSRAEIIEKTVVPGRDDIGIVTIKLIGEKYVTDAGMRALEAVKFGGLDNIYEENGNRYLRVLTLEQVLAIPTDKAFN